jgi:hypothetical protein
METVLVMMMVKKLSKSTLQSGEQDPAAPENEDRDGGGALGLIKFLPPRNRIFSNI